MKKIALVSCTKTGLNIYLPSELAKHVSGKLYRAEMVAMRDDSRCLRLYSDHTGRNGFTLMADGRVRLQIHVGNLPEDIRNMPFFSATEAKWSRGEEPGEVYLDVPPESARAAPLVRRKLNSTRSRLEVPAPVVKESPHERLRRLVTELNALLASGEVSDVTLSATVLADDGTPLVGCELRGPIAGRRIEEF